jgi:hypothetical protein
MDMVKVGRGGGHTFWGQNTELHAFNALHCCLVNRKWWVAVMQRRQAGAAHPGHHSDSSRKDVVSEPTLLIGHGCRMQFDIVRC